MITSRFPRALALVAAMLALLPGLARAQASCGELFKAPAVGSWAEWRHNTDRLVRMAVVGQETRDGTPLFWMETQLKEGDGAGTVVKFLVPGFPYEMKGVQEVVMKPAGQQAMKLSSQMLEMMRSQMPEDPTSQIFRKCEQVERLGTESVTVAAGTFRAEKLRDPESGDLAWVDTKVPFGMVRAQVEGEGVIELAGYGTGATSAITETPMEVPGF